MNERMNNLQYLFSYLPAPNSSVIKYILLVVWKL